MDTSGSLSSIGLSSEEINAAADAAQAMFTNPDQSGYSTQDIDSSKDPDADIWGLKGLLEMVKDEDSDSYKIALGVDLTTLGLNMNQPE